VEAASTAAVEAATAKAASVTTATTSVTAATTTAASGGHGWLNQADSRQCEQSYNRFPHHASLRSVGSLPTHTTLSQWYYSAIEERSR
jgi:hypothetical protein